MTDISNDRERYRAGDLLIDAGVRRVSRGDRKIPLPGLSFDLLLELVRAAPEVVSVDRLTDRVWPERVVNSETVSKRVTLLREALGDNIHDPRYLLVERGRGYRWLTPVTPITEERETPAAFATGAPQTSSASRELKSEGDALDKPARDQRPLTPAGTRSSAVSRRATLALLVAVVAVASAAFWATERSSTFAPDPLRGYEFSRLTEHEGAEEHAAISRDGRFVAFLSDRNGAWDVWAGQIGTGDFSNLTAGTMRELRNPAVRTVGFTPDGSQVMVWTRTTDGGAVDAGWAVPTVGGGALEPYRTGISELDWSPDGNRIVYHTPAPGDPLFVMNTGQGDPLQIHVAAPGVHCHFPLWSRDGEFVYFVQGLVPDKMDVWRIPSTGGTPEQITFHNSRVSHPTFLNDHTLLYLATAEDGSGPWLHAADVNRGEWGRRLSTGGQEYTSIAASADGTRLVGTAARSTSSLWRVPINDRDGRPAEAERVTARTPRGSSPRTAPDFILYRAPRAGVEGLWKLADGTAIELTSGLDGRVVAGASLAPNGRRVAFPLRRRGLTELYVMNTDGSDARSITEGIDVRGAPDWSPDGESIAFAAMRNGEPRLFTIPANGGQSALLGDEYAVDPVWSPSGRFLVYSGEDVGTNFPVKAINADGTPHAAEHGPEPRLEAHEVSRRGSAGRAQGESVSQGILDRRPAER